MTPFIAMTAATIALSGAGLHEVATVATVTVSSVRIDDGVLSFVAADHTTNRVSVGPHPNHPGYFLVTDVAGPYVTAQAPCVVESANPRAGRCPAAGITSIRIDLGDLNDGAANKTCWPSVMLGRGHDDQLIGGCGPDLIMGGPGDDTIRGGQADDLLYGEAGNDFIDGEQGANDLGDGGSDLDPDTCVNTEQSTACS